MDHAWQCKRNYRFYECLKLQWRVMHALFLRELITRFGRDNLGVLWLVGEPMIFTLGVATLWTAAGLAHGGTGIPIVAFAVTGYSSVLMWRNATTHCSGGIAANRPLLYHRRVKVIDVYLARIALEVIGATGSFIVLSTFFIYIGWMPMPNDLMQVLGGWLMLAWFGIESRAARRRRRSIFGTGSPIMAPDLLPIVSDVRSRVHGGMVAAQAANRCFVFADGPRRGALAARLFWKCRQVALRSRAIWQSAA